MPDKRQVILVLDTANPYQRKIIQGVAGYAHQHGSWQFHLVHDSVESLVYLNTDPLENLPNLRTFRADGVLATFQSPKMASRLRALKVPVISIEAESGWNDSRWRIPDFSTDNEAIGRLGAEDLIGRGLKQLAFCGIPPTRLTRWSEQRQEAFQRAAEQAGVPCSVFVSRSGQGQGSSLAKELSAWLASLPKPIGLMACHDVRARHVLAACRELDLLAPEEIAVLGVDNDELICELTSPTLSSIEQGARTLGHQAMAMLDRWLGGENVSREKYVIPPDGIVTRRSSDTLAIEDQDVAQAVRFIQQNACTGIRVHDVVQAVAVSRSGLESRFKIRMGRTIHAEIQRVQIERARHLVATTNLPLKEVAAATGFAYVQHLTTVFRTVTGRTPGQYRRAART